MDQSRSIVAAWQLVKRRVAAAISGPCLIAIAFNPAYATATAIQIAPEINPAAFWVDTTICSVVLKTSIDADKPMLPGTPIDQLSSLGAICTSNISGQNLVPGGVRSLIIEGFRVTSLSHHVAVLTPSSAGGKAEVLISVLFALERPQRILSR